MWQLRKILLRQPPARQAILLGRDMLALNRQAEQLIADAEREAQEIIDEARTQAETLRQQAKTECDALLAGAQDAFCHQAQTLFTDWQHQRGVEQQQLLDAADELLEQALGRLLDEVPSAKQLDILLTQLRAKHPPVAAATLYCHSEMHAAVTHWLVQRPELRWQPTINDTLPPDTLLLTTEQGELHISWQALRQALSVGDAEAG
ncbi:type III secretion system stator protein SctL [Pantoea stewartii]|uniref:type III secretion system stator protein SctL n=1 Tax=Pantoea stewartii TaxID=66269 RepID=UPI0021D488E0|nr:type III secretion system stator protein SctL [Pantoea stewartii]MCU7369223.1 type III secretion system stator protein SctL [Pantoea stewartii]